MKDLIAQIKANVTLFYERAYESIPLKNACERFEKGRADLQELKNLLKASGSQYATGYLQQMETLEAAQKAEPTPPQKPPQKPEAESAPAIGCPGAASAEKAAEPATDATLATESKQTSTAPEQPEPEAKEKTEEESSMNPSNNNHEMESLETREYGPDLFSAMEAMMGNLPDEKNNDASAGSSAKPSQETEDAATVAEKGNGGEGNFPVAKVSELKPHPLTEALFEKEESVLERLKEKMRKDGHKKIVPLYVIRDESGFLVVDGLTRLQAAEETGLEFLPIQVTEYREDWKILLDAVTMQHKRRGNDSKTILKSVSALLPYASDIAQSRQGKNMTSTQHWGEVGKGSSGIIAEIIGVSATTVDKAKKVLEFEDFTKKVMSDDKFSINKAYNEIVACLKGMAGEKERKAMEPVDGKPAKTDEATEAETPTAKPASSTKVAQKSVVETPQTIEAEFLPDDPPQEEIESIAQALENFNQEDTWECLKRLPDETLVFLGKRISEKLNESEEAKSNA